MLAYRHFLEVFDCVNIPEGVQRMMHSLSTGCVFGSLCLIEVFPLNPPFAAPMAAVVLPQC